MIMPSAAQKEDRLNIRLSDREKQLLVAAANARHITTSQFVIQASLSAAEEVLADQSTITFTPEQWDAFQSRLDEPPKVIPALQKLFSEPGPF